MADCGINVLAQQGNRALVRVTCAACSDENLLQIIFQTEGDLAEADTPRPKLWDEPAPDGMAAISSDELLDVHDTLDRWQGSLSELVGASSSDH